MVVPVWVDQPPAGRVLVPPSQLAGFARAEVDAGSSTTAELSLSTDWLKVTVGDVNGVGPRVLAAGEYTVRVGEEEATFTVH